MVSRDHPVSLVPLVPRVGPGGFAFYMLAILLWSGRDSNLHSVDTFATVLPMPTFPNPDVFPSVQI